MAFLRSIESKIEGLFEGVFGRAFRTHVQPIELARKLVKEMDDHRSVSVSRVYVPNEYTIYLSPQDHRQFGAYEDSLVTELADYLAEHARRERYALLTPPKVLVTTDDDLAVGEFGIATRIAADEAAEDAVLPELPLDLEQPPQTMVYRSPAPPVEEAEEPEVVTLTIGAKTYSASRPRTTLGRSRQCDVHVTDANVSRRHAEVRHEGSEYWVVDLGSTNGTLVNGEQVERARLRDGDRITIGATEIVFGRPTELDR
ncbi:MAG TPA: DUF3662 and FHA domain-containing protein [Gaiellaceae bacterium]|nr:DUF3662 and FHA domain-containing protein [Gaiellaceae bacterium]